jgi:hypothetical protein
MPFTVTWDSAALNKLAGIYVNAPNRRAVAKASHQVEQLLRFMPESAGFRLSANRRVIVILPLKVVFSVSPLDFLVRFLDITALP